VGSVAEAGSGEDALLPDMWPREHNGSGKFAGAPVAGIAGE